jgi:cytochrome c oxidase cbb3-type subunit III
MNSTVSILVMAFVALNVLACVWLLLWTAKKRPEDLTKDPTTGHVWDGDLMEYNNPLPRWWLNSFYLTIFFGIGYLVFYPGLGNLSGRLGWTSAKQHDQDAALTRASFDAAYAPFRSMTFAQLANEPGAQALGQSIYVNNCAGCHGSDARGAKGFPNLTDGDWQYGGDPETILTTIRIGRQAAMPPWQTVVGDDGVAELVAHVQQLSGTPVGDTLASRGKQRFDMLCVACHGADGRGNQALGAPNLTDDIWLYGGDPDTLTESLVLGRNGQMPAFKTILTEAQIQLVSAWVYAQSHNSAAVQTAQQGAQP